MQGRQEHEKQTENRIFSIMQNHSNIIKKYYGYIDNKTHNTKLMYINRVINYLNYLKNKSINIEDVYSYASIKPSDIREYLNTKNRYSAEEIAEKINAISL